MSLYYSRWHYIIAYSSMVYRTKNKKYILVLPVPVKNKKIKKKSKDTSNVPHNLLTDLLIYMEYERSITSTLSTEGQCYHHMLSICVLSVGERPDRIRLALREPKGFESAPWPSKCVHHNTVPYWVENMTADWTIDTHFLCSHDAHFVVFHGISLSKDIPNISI